MPQAHGPDTSHYQQILNQALLPQWELWTHKAGEGRSYRDPTLGAYWPIMKAHAKRVGVYFWLRPDSTPDEQFNNLAGIVASLGGLKPGMCVQIDWERTDAALAVNGGFPTLAQVERFQALCERAWPGRVIMYTASWVKYFAEWRKRNPDFPLWYANYTGSAVPVGKSWNATVVQWTSTYRHPAIAGGFDMNEILDFDVLDRVCGMVETAPQHIDLIQAPTKPPVPVIPALTYPTPVPADFLEEEMFLVDSASIGSALITVSFRDNGTVGYQMWGIDSGHVRGVLGGGLKALPLPDADYQAWSQLGDPK